MKPTLPQQVHDLMLSKGMTIAVAESLTGGGVGALITSVGGSSGYFAGGVVAYTMEHKVKLLGVDGTHAAEVNCVSEQVAQEMAEGVRQMFNADIGIATTGYADAWGEHGEKAQLAHIAIASKERGGASVVHGRCVGHVDGSPDRVAFQRDVAAWALRLLIEVWGVPSDAITSRDAPYSPATTGN